VASTGYNKTQLTYLSIDLVACFLTQNVSSISSDNSI